MLRLLLLRINRKFAATYRIKFGYGKANKTRRRGYVASMATEQLYNKRYLVAKQHGLVYHFTPKIAQTDYKADFMSNFVGNYFKNSFREMVSFFAKKDKISPEDLRDIISEIEKGKDTE